jgi:membrane dipeptidase
MAAGSGHASSMGATLSRMARVRRQIEERSDWLVLAPSVRDIREAQARGRLAVHFNLQETLPFETDLDLVQLYYDLGVRQTLLAYNQKNLVGDGCAERTDAGLSRFGVEVVKEMNRVGMLVDGSHSGYRTTMDAMAVCEGPFIFSHSNPLAVKRHYRNIADDQIVACAASGGVIGINGVGTFVGDPNASTDAVFRCLDYTVELVGPDHVGLGFDYVDDIDSVYEWTRNAPLAWPPFEGEEMPRHRFASAEQIGELVQLMLEHGYPDDAIVGILGENWARVCERVWKSE